MSDGVAGFSLQSAAFVAHRARRECVVQVCKLCGRTSCDDIVQAWVDSGHSVADNNSQFAHLIGDVIKLLPCLFPASTVTK